LLELELGRTEEAFLRAREISTTPAVLSMAGLDRIQAAVRGGAGATARARLAFPRPRLPRRRRGGVRTPLRGRARHARRGGSPLRTCAHGARLRRVPPPSTTTAPGTRAPSGGSRRIRGTRGRAVGGTGT